MKRIKKYQNVIIAILLFSGIFLLMAMFKNTSYFTDEGDNLLGGVMVTSGKLVYQDFASQHLPGGYYIFALFKILGAASVFSLRLYAYAFIAFYGR